MFDRSERRHHIERLKETRKTYWGYGRRGETMSAAQLGRVIQHPQICSCPACGNPRRSVFYKGERLTLQERSQIEALKTYELEPSE
jgi:hypothetical protein